MMFGLSSFELLQFLFLCAMPVLNKVELKLKIKNLEICKRSTPLIMKCLFSSSSLVRYEVLNSVYVRFLIILFTYKFMRYL